MKGTHGILQAHCSVCIGAFLVGDELVMRVVQLGDNSVTGKPAGVMVDYLHTYCRRPEGER